MNIWYELETDFFRLPAVSRAAGNKKTLAKGETYEYKFEK